MRRSSIAALMLCAVLIPATLCMAGLDPKPPSEGPPAVGVQQSSATAGKAPGYEPTVLLKSSGSLGDDLHLQHELFNLGWYSMIMVTSVFEYAATDNLQALVNYREVVDGLLAKFPDPETRRMYGLAILSDSLDDFDAEEVATALGAYLSEVEVGVTSTFGQEGLWLYELGVNDRRMGEFLEGNAEYLHADMPTMSFSGQAPQYVPKELAFLADTIVEHSGQEQLVCMMGGLYEGYNSYWFSYFDFPDEE